MRLLLAISHHGFGHLAQAAPIANALSQLRPNLEWLVWSGLSRETLSSRLAVSFSHRHDAADVGLVMHDAVRVDVSASLTRYLAFHQDWEEKVSREASWLIENRISAVLSDVAYLPLAAAALADLPAVAFCSLNWLDIANAYLGDQPEIDRILTRISSAYAASRAFLRLTPSMPMDWLKNSEALPPIASRGKDQRAEIDARLNNSADRKLVLIGFGGVAYRSEHALPVLPDVLWLVPDSWPTDDREDLIGFSGIGLPFMDLLASSDVLVTKIGYGSFVEAASHGVPVLYLDRPDWPETPYLTTWLREHGHAHSITETQLFDPGVHNFLAELWEQPRKALIKSTGADLAANRIRELIGLA